MLVALAALAALAAPALAEITITGPSANAYWVQHTSNQITWSYAQGDPNPISILISNPNTTYLNGPFSIAEAVDLSNKSFTVTNVTLNVHPGYVVSFVNGRNASQVYATSGTFDVRPPGTSPVAQDTPSGSAPAPTATSPSGSGSAGGPRPTSGSGNSTGSTNSTSDATHGVVVSGASVALALVGALVAL